MEGAPASRDILSSQATGREFKSTTDINERMR